MSPQTPHLEKHFTASAAVRDVVIGMSDGLTVPFALAAGLSGAVAASSIVVTAGIAEVVAGAIAMGLGGYLAGKSDAEHYASELRRETNEAATLPEVEAAEVEAILTRYGLTREQAAPMVEALRANPEAWVDFMMRFELNLEQPEPSQAGLSAARIGGSYAVGGLIPLSPYFLIPEAHQALGISILLTMLALAVFGFVKGRFTGTKPWRSALQTLVIGAFAAGAAYFVAKLIS